MMGNVMINNIANASFTMNRITPYLRRLAKDDQFRGFAEQVNFSRESSRNDQKDGEVLIARPGRSDAEADPPEADRLLCLSFIRDRKGP